MSKLVINVFERQSLVFSSELDGEVELGRQSNPGEANPYTVIRVSENRSRLIIAELAHTIVSRTHALVRATDDQRLEVTNLSGSLPIGVAGGQAMLTGSQRIVEIPARLILGDRQISIEFPESEELQLQSLALPTIAPSVQGDASRNEGADAWLSLLEKSGEGTLAVSSGGNAVSILRCLRATIGVLERAANAPDFLPLAARAVVDMVGLDRAAVLHHNEGRWETAVYHDAAGAAMPDGWHPSGSILSRLLEEKRTFRHSPGADLSPGSSLRQVKSLVAAPILNSGGDVIGAFYGDRQGDSISSGESAITELDATLIELVTRSVASGLARLDQEKAALAARVQFEQFFSPRLARLLEEDPELLTGKDTRITVLFCDIRGFSRVSERLGPGKTVAWINDVLDALSECVINHGGVLVDYIGDELMAMWGAPLEQQDHARLACRAAIDMLAALGPLNAAWQRVLGCPFDLGIGINTGIARVGNTGSRRKFKYGPLGNTVNLASRVQSATKSMNTTVLISGDTANCLDAEFFTRRLGTARVSGIERPTDLFELVPDPEPAWLELKKKYESALQSLEEQDFQSSIAVLAEILSRTPDDGPSIQLLSRAVHWNSRPNITFSPIIEFTSK